MEKAIRNIKPKNIRTRATTESQKHQSRLCFSGSNTLIPKTIKLTIPQQTMFKNFNLIF